jgi:hypothetical protein
VCVCVSNITTNTIILQTDLENCDYQAEHGSTRLFDARKVLSDQAKEVADKEAEDATNPMKMLEKRTKMSRNEMEALS